MKDEITFVVTLPARPEHAEGVGADLLALLSASRAEAGCVEYNVHRGAQGAPVWMVYETWRSQADFDAHLEKPYTKAFMASLPARLTAEIGIAPYAMVSPRA